MTNPVTKHVRSSADPPGSTPRGGVQKRTSSFSLAVRGSQPPPVKAQRGAGSWLLLGDGGGEKRPGRASTTGSFVSGRGVTVHKSHGLVRTSVFKSRYGTVRFIVKGKKLRNKQ